jgi:hypothetical protein
MGKKLLSSEEFEAWFAKHNEIINDMNLNHLQKQDKMSELFEEIEDQTLPPHKVNMRVHNLLQSFIISGGFEV